MWVDLHKIHRLLLCLSFFVLTIINSTAVANETQKSRNFAVTTTTTNHHHHAASGCLHNNSLFADTSIIPTTEPCLLCKCSTRNLICVRRVCKDQPYPPPRGCILVHKKNVCCPYLSCSKQHLQVNYYKNSERNRDHHFNNNLENEQQVKHEKTLEKHSRVDDGEDEQFNGGCIESGSLYASGSAMMMRSSSSLCSYCYCINGRQKCIRPKCLLRDTRCKPIFIDASCCPVKYDCNFNSTLTLPDKSNKNDKNPNSHQVQRKNRSNGCFDDGRFYREGERLPVNDNRPCEMCYCIKGFRKCVVKKCAPLIKGCIPKVPKDGSCCPTSYDCSRSIKFKRQVRQNSNVQQESLEVEDDDNDSIDFFSLLFGSDEPPQEEVKNDAVTVVKFVETTTIQPFKVLPTTESSFLDFLRAGLDLIDKNADTFGSVLSSNFTTTDQNQSSSLPEATTPKTTIIVNTKSSAVDAVKNVKTTQPSTTTQKSIPTTFSATTTKPKVSHNSSTTGRTPLATAKSTATIISSTPTTTQRPKKSSTLTTKTRVSTSTRRNIIESESTTKKMTTIRAQIQDLKMKTIPAMSTTMRVKPSATLTTRRQTTTKLPPVSSTTAKSSAIITRKAQTTTTTTTVPRIIYKEPSIIEGTRQVIPTFTSTDANLPIRNPYDDYFNSIAHQLPSRKVVNDGDNEAETMPDIEIIPFVAHDAIDRDKFDSYHQHHHHNPYEESLEKDYFAVSNTEKPFRYNNKFIQHSATYEDAVEYGGAGAPFPNPHERIDNGPYYFEANEENQYEAFSPPSEQDFIGGFSPKETLFDEPSKFSTTIKNHEETKIRVNEHKSNVTSETSTFSINQTTTTHRGEVIDDVIPNFKKISNNFTSYLDNFLQHETSTVASAVSTTTKLQTKAPSTSTSTSHQPELKDFSVKSQIDDDDFIRKHFKTSAPWDSSHKKDHNDDGVMEIFSKPTTPTMNGLLKLAGCNIYGQMYNVGQLIPELSNACLDCKCLPDIGVGCTTKC